MNNFRIIIFNRLDPFPAYIQTIFCKINSRYKKAKMISKRKISKL